MKSHQPSGGALSDLRVVDLSNGIAGAFCSRMFADFGADVIKIESPSDDPTRILGPFPVEDADPEDSGMFMYLNVSKRGVTLDLENRARSKPGRQPDHERRRFGGELPSRRYEEHGLGI